MHHPSFVYFYTHVVLPQWIELGIEGDYKVRIKKYLAVHSASEHLNNRLVLEFFGINVKKRKRSGEDDEIPPAKKPPKSRTNIKCDDLLAPPSTPERTADSPLNIDYFMYE